MVALEKKREWETDANTNHREANRGLRIVHYKITTFFFSVVILSHLFQLILRHTFHDSSNLSESHVKDPTIIINTIKTIIVFKILLTLLFLHYPNLLHHYNQIKDPIHNTFLEVSAIEYCGNYSWLNRYALECAVCLISRKRNDVIDIVDIRYLTSKPSKDFKNTFMGKFSPQQH